MKERNSIKLFPLDWWIIIKQQMKRRNVSMSVDSSLNQDC